MFFAVEPLAVLDTGNGNNVMILLKMLTRENHSAILVGTHDHRNPTLIDRMFHVNKGRITKKS